MLKYFCIVIFLLSSMAIAKAQDTLVLKNGSVIRAKVIEIRPDVIIYKKYTYQDGPSITIPKSTVSVVRYPDGSADSITATPAEEKPAITDKRTAMVYFYRPANMLSSARSSDIYVNDSFTCKIGNGKMQVVELPTGMYMFKSKIDQFRDSAELKLENGRLYYIKCLVKSSLLTDRPMLELMDMKGGAEEVAKMQKVFNLYQKPKKEKAPGKTR